MSVKDKLLLVSWIASVLLLTSLIIPIVEPNLASIIWESFWGKMFFGSLYVLAVILQVHCILVQRKTSSNKFEFWLLILVGVYSAFYFYKKRIKTMDL